MTDSRSWFWLAIAGVTGWLVWLLAPVITPFAISAGLAYLSDPLVDRLERVTIRRWTLGRTTAVVLVFVLLFGLITLVLLFAIPRLVQQLAALVERIPEYLDWFVHTAIPWLSQRLGVDLVAFDAEGALEVLKDYGAQAGRAVLNVVETVGRGGAAVVAVVTNLVLVPVITFYLMRDWDRLVQGIRDLLPRGVEGDVAGIAREIDDVLGAFIRGQLIVMMALGLIYAIGLWALGLDMAFLIGMIAGLLSIVPYLGSFIGLALAVGMALFQFGDIWHLVGVLAVFGVGQTLEGMVLTPNLVGDRIGLHPVAVIFAVLAGGQLFGFLGILLALPAAAALNVLVMHLNQKYRDSDLYKDAEG